MIKNILAIIGSTRANSSNLRLVKKLEEIAGAELRITYYEDIDKLPHFNPDLDNENPPIPVIEFRNKVAAADGVIICTPEYVFSIPGSLKNALEWCVSTVIFTNKPTGLITASASGEKGHAQLQLVMKTVGALFTEETCLLINGIKGKFDAEGNLANGETINQLEMFAEGFKKLLGD